MNEKLKKEVGNITFSLKEIESYMALVGKIPTEYGMPIAMAINIDILKKKQALEKEKGNVPNKSTPPPPVPGTEDKTQDLPSKPVLDSNRKYNFTDPRL